MNSNLITKCQKCGREIFFGVNPGTGRKIPLVAKPITAFIVDEALKVNGLPLAKPAQVYISHFADCPAANYFRKPNPKGARTDGHKK